MNGYTQLYHMYDEARRAELEHVTVYERFLSDARETARREQPVLDALSLTERILGHVDMPLLWEGMD